MTDIIVIGIVAIIVGAAMAYIIKAKKAGAKCIGCPAAGTCSSKKNASEAGCSCGCGNEDRG